MGKRKTNINSKKIEYEEFNFEQALKRIEEIVNQLEAGELGLEESLDLFEEGIKLTHLCNNKLKMAERRIEVLIKDEKGEVHTRPAQIDDEKT